MSTDHNLFEEKGEPKRNRAEALLLTSGLTPYRWAKPAHRTGAATVIVCWPCNRTSSTLNDHTSSLRCLPKLASFPLFKSTGLLRLCVVQSAPFSKDARTSQAAVVRPRTHFPVPCCTSSSSAFRDCPHTSSLTVLMKLAGCLYQVLFGAPELFCKRGSLRPVLRPCFLV